jgi:hypothetical protein
MKHYLTLLSMLALGIPAPAAQVGSPLPSTVYTRALLKATNAASARNVLGVTTNGDMAAAVSPGPNVTVSTNVAGTEFTVGLSDVYTNAYWTSWMDGAGKSWLSNANFMAWRDTNGNWWEANAALGTVAGRTNGVWLGMGPDSLT